jgi:hypothetical protein
MRFPWRRTAAAGKAAGGQAGLGPGVITGTELQHLADDVVIARLRQLHVFGGFTHLRNAVAVLESKATAEELEEYRRFVLTLAGKVAAAHREHGQTVSPDETEAIHQIAEALGTSSR